MSSEERANYELMCKQYGKKSIQAFAVRFERIGGVWWRKHTEPHLHGIYRDKFTGEIIKK